MNIRFSKNARKIRGFTLVELIVVITILAVLATVGFLALSGYSQDAKDSAIKANVRSVQAAIATEGALSNNSPRYYVVHDTDYALSGAFAYVDGASVALTGGDVGAPPADSNYTAGKPNWARLKLNPDKFRISSSGLPGGTLGVVARASGFGSDGAEASYDASSVMAAGADFVSVGPSGRKRVVSYSQAAAVSPSTKLASVAGSFPTSGAPAGNVSGLLRAEPGSATNLTGSLVDGSVSNGTSSAASYASCAAIKTALPSSADGVYSIDPDGVGGAAAFNAYCDMTTNGGGWTLVFSSNNGTRFNVSTDAGTDVSSASYTMTMAKKAAVASSATSTMILYGSNKFVWSNVKLPFTATTTYEKICGTTTSDSLDGATSKCFGWSPTGIATGWVFGVTNSSGFDHHNTTNYMMLNSSCVGHYVYEYNSAGGSGYKYGSCDNAGTSTVRLSYFMK